MRETMSHKIIRLLDDENVYMVEMVLKCKTKDGMIYTVEVYEIDRKDCQADAAGVPFAEAVNSRACCAVAKLTETISAECGYTTSLYDLTSIRNSEISRIWVELGEFYTREGHRYPNAG